MLRFSALIVVLMCLSGLSGVMGVFKRADPFESYGVVMLDSVIWDKVVPNYNSNTVVMVCAKGSIGKQETDSIRDHFMDMGEYSGMQHNILYSQIIVNGAENAMMVNKKFGITNPNKELKRPKFFIYLPGSETPISLQTREIPEPDPTDLTYLITKHTGT